MWVEFWLGKKLKSAIFDFCTDLSTFDIHMILFSNVCDSYSFSRERFIITYKMMYAWHKFGSQNPEKNLIKDDKKTYDVFISYASEDHEWVTEELVPKLEKEHQFKCCFHERDFQIGVTVMQNIVNCVDKVSFIYYVITCRGKGRS